MSYHPVVTHLNRIDLERLDIVCKAKKCSRYKFLRDVLLEGIKSYEEVMEENVNSGRDQQTRLEKDDSGDREGDRRGVIKIT